MMSETAVVKLESLNLKEYGAREDIAALGRRVKTMLPGGNQMTDDQAMAIAQYAISLDANPFRGEIYGFENRGQFILVDGYKLLVRWAKKQCPYSEKFESLPLEEMEPGAIGYRCWILREDGRAMLHGLVKDGATFKDAYEIVATFADGVVTSEDMFTRAGKELKPPKGWTWDQVARKRSLKNALNLSHGAPSPKEIAAESWIVDGIETTPEDWKNVPQDESAYIREQIVIANHTARKSHSRIGEMTDDERRKFLGESRALLRGTQDDINGNLIRQKPEKQDDNESESEPEIEDSEWAAALMTSKGTPLGDMSADQLTWIIEHPDDATDNQVRAAGILLDNMIPV